MKYFAYRNFLKLQANVNKYELQGELDIKFIMPMPTSWSKKKMELMDGTPCQGSPDIDNLVKAFCDAMSSQDNFVWKVKAEKRWGKTGKVIVFENNVLNNISTDGC